MESSPSSLGTIFEEVLKLTDDDREKLLKLLEQTSLSAIIQSANIVSERLAFLNGLEQLVHDKVNKPFVKERSQLHRLLAHNLWIFGDEYLLGGDDVRLSTVLKQHLAIIGDPTWDTIDTSKMKDLRDVPDLVLWKKFMRGKGDKFEFVVIELKRPLVKISQTELVQTKKYATKIMANTNFDKTKCHYKFIAISDEIADDALEDVNQSDRQPGHVLVGKHHDIFAYRWSEILHGTKVRLE
ncbi:MAG: hypothetical protein JKY95_19280 [Planctomycetaceae bacterium]|nr:hypothetical protein [Planctomycetaceae bacterium]